MYRKKHIHFLIITSYPQYKYTYLSTYQFFCPSIYVHMEFGLASEIPTHRGAWWTELNALQGALFPDWFTMSSLVMHWCVVFHACSKWSGPLNIWLDEKTYQLHSIIPFILPIIRLVGWLLWLACFPIKKSFCWAPWPVNTHHPILARGVA